MGNLEVYDYMKWYFLLTFFITNILVAQKIDSVKVDQDSLFFEYRFKIQNVDNNFEVNRLESTLNSLFQTKPVFHKDIAQYVFNSQIEIDEDKLIAVLRNYELRLEYYRKTSLILK